jgi:hypothetical protein
MRLGVTGREVQLRAIAEAASGGFVCLYSDRAPLNADDVIGRDVSLLAELSVDGVPELSEGWLRFTVRGIGLLLGRASWFRVLTSSRRVLVDGTAGRTEGDMVMAIDLVQPGAPITLTFTYTIPQQAGD